jgi:hypothetical protein
MQLEDFGLSINLLEMIRGSGMQMFAVKRRKLYLPEAKLETFKKNSILRIPFVFRGKTIANVYFTQNSNVKNIEIVVDCPTKKTNSARRYSAWCLAPDTLGLNPTIDDLFQIVISAMKSYQGTNQQRVDALAKDLEQEYIQSKWTSCS